MRTSTHDNWKHDAGNEKQINLDIIMSHDWDIESEYHFNIIKKQIIPHIDIHEFMPICGRTALWNNRAVHGFVDDYRLNKWWKKLEYYTNQLVSAKVVFTPDYSIYSDMPKYLQLYQLGRTRLVGTYMQSKGIKVVPTVIWGDETTYPYCFLGIEKGCDIAFSTHIGRDYKDNRLRDSFLAHVSKAIEVIQPEKLWIYNERFDTEIKKLHDNVQFIPSHSKWIRDNGKKTK